jgi:molybdenum cofactor cytidylyltransferase
MTNGRERRAADERGGDRAQRVAGLVLAAGRAARFGSAKLLAPLAGRPVLGHVLAAAAEAGLDRILVVLPPGADGDALQRLVADARAGSVRNRDPDRGLSSSVLLGLAVLAADDSIDAVAVLPGDQPLVRPHVIRAAVAAALEGERPITVARHAGDGAPNPVVLRREAFGASDLLADLAADRGFGPILAARPELVTEVAVEGANPDIDRPADLLAADWALRVRANRDQVDRVREVPDGRDFYAPVRRLFRDDPDRTGDAVLDAIATHVRPGDVVLDVGAGAGRYALPLARRAREVVALDPSGSMLDALREDAEAHGIANVRAIEGRWPPGGPDAPGAGLTADVSLLAHLGYDIEAIGPFLDALELATRRTCVAVLMSRSPASLASPFWPLVHDVERAELPALDELVALLEARGATPSVTGVERPPRAYSSRDDAFAALERQLWVREGGERHRRLVRAFDERVVERPEGWFLESEPGRIGIVSWAPKPPASAVRNPR